MKTDLNFRGLELNTIVAILEPYTIVLLASGGLELNAIVAIPEPYTIVLLASGGLALLRKRRT